MKIKAKVNLVNENSVLCGNKAYNGKDVVILGFGEMAGFGSPDPCAFCAIEENGNTVLRVFNVCDLVLTEKVF